MIDLNEKENKSLYYFLRKFLKDFEIAPRERKFWEEIYNLEDLFSVRDKLKKNIEDA